MIVSLSKRRPHRPNRPSSSGRGKPLTPGAIAAIVCIFALFLIIFFSTFIISTGPKCCKRTCFTKCCCWPKNKVEGEENENSETNNSNKEQEYQRPTCTDEFGVPIVAQSYEGYSVQLYSNQTFTYPEQCCMPQQVLDNGDQYKDPSTHYDQQSINSILPPSFSVSSPQGSVNYMPEAKDKS